MDDTPIEIEIQRILSEAPTLQQVADRIVAKISAPEISDRERIAYWYFLFNAGYHHEVLVSFIQRLAAKQRIHWGIFVEMLAKLGVEPPNSVIESIFKGVKRQDARDDLWAIDCWDNWDARFANIRKMIGAEKSQEARQSRENLVEKFHFLKNQRMHEQAGRILKRLIFLFPDDASYQQMKVEFDEEWAREVISQRYTGGAERDKLVEAPQTQDEQTALAECIKFAESVCANQPTTAFDLAIFFYFLEAWEPSLLFAQKCAPVPSSDWLIAELLLHLRRYVDALEHLNSVESRYIDDPETVFGAAYLRAQALQALGQSATAVEILRNIVQVRPNYRSAQQLITEWSVGAVAG